MSDINDLPSWVRDNQAFKINLNHSFNSEKGVQKESPVPANVGGSANVISSKTSSGYEKFHYPLLDLDIPHALIPSSTDGHSHLYLNVLLTRSEYRELLSVLNRLHIIQDGILKQFDEHGATFLRLPDVKKSNPDPPPF